uniref:Uncharacterized protein n=1 Tax=Arundo donax TaxID=35708 RepID=A0A0A9BSK9_ARUDO
MHRNVQMSWMLWQIFAGFCSSVSLYTIEVLQDETIASMHRNVQMSWMLYYH